MEKYNSPLILIIDDEEAILKTLKDALVDESYRVSTLSDGNKALGLIGKLVPDLILLDIFMPNCNGLQLLSKIKKEYPAQKVIIISGFGNIPIAIEAVQKGAIDFIEKPLNLDEILNKLSFLQNTSQPEKKESFSDKSLLRECNIIGESNLFLELIQQIEKFAPYNFPILIYGEYGTGKTALSKYIHKKSLLSKNDFSKIDCATTIEKNFEEKVINLFEGEKQKTVFIKNIEQLDQKNQIILLNLIEQNEINKKHRIIASSKTSLFNLIKNNKFNELLFYYLNKAPIEVPPLRKRPYDIPLLINNYLNKYNSKHNKKTVLTTQSIRLLRNHKWPGNITQLKQIIEKIVISTDENYSLITPQELKNIFGEKEIQFIEEQSMFNFDSLDQATQELKKSFLLYLLQKNHYNIDQVSDRLNLSSIQLKNKLIELKIKF